MRAVDGRRYFYKRDFFSSENNYCSVASEMTIKICVRVNQHAKPTDLHFFFFLLLRPRFWAPSKKDGGLLKPSSTPLKQCTQSSSVRYFQIVKRTNTKKKNKLKTKNNKNDVVLLGWPRGVGTRAAYNIAFDEID